MKLAVLVSIALPLLCGPTRADTALDPKSLDNPITVKLRDASMTEAVTAIGKVGDIPIAAPAEPSDGLSMALIQQPARKVLDYLAGATRMKWEVIEGVVVFRKPAQTSGAEPPKTGDSLTPEQSMAALLASMNSLQMYKLSVGVSLAHVELSPYQKGILGNLLSPSMVGVTDDGETVSGLPTPEVSRLAFFTIPYLSVPDPGAKKPITLRLDSRPYISLRKAGAK